MVSKAKTGLEVRERGVLKSHIRYRHAVTIRIMPISRPPIASYAEMHFLRSIMPSVPTEMATQIRKLCLQSSNETLLENLVRFISGGPCPLDSSVGLREQWIEKQTATKIVLVSLNPILLDRKRMRTEEEDLNVEADSQVSKKQRLSPSGPSPPPIANGNAPTQIVDHGVPRFTLNSISTTSPIRKKVDITVHQNALVFRNPSTKAIEGSVPLSTLRRAFIVPTRGKSKPHWTIILLSSDILENSKFKQAASSENQQVIFGLDANSTAAFTTTSYTNDGDPRPQILPKHTPTLNHIQTFLSNLGIPVILHSSSTFKSACGGVLAGSSASPDGIPGVEAYRAAKPGNLWFSDEGILWGESKPCEFWAVKDLIGREDGVRIIGTGKTCTVVLTRLSAGQGGEDDENAGEETEFGMVDGKEREPITAWVRSHRHLFGTTKTEMSKGKGKEKEERPKLVHTGPMTINSIADDSDEEDEEFNAGVSELDGSEATSDESSSDSGSGTEDDEGDEDAEGTDDNNDSDGEDLEELDVAHHPLLRPGAIPRMSKSAMEMAIGMVEEAFMGDGGEKQDEEDELDDDEEDELQD